jgi:hypothetical protein
MFRDQGSIWRNSIPAENFLNIFISSNLGQISPQINIHMKVTSLKLCLESIVKPKKVIIRNYHLTM